MYISRLAVSVIAAIAFSADVRANTLNYVFQGDSITQNFGASSANTSYVGDVAADPSTANGTVYSCGVGGARANTTVYFPSGVTPTVVPISTMTGTASSATGLSGTMDVGGLGIPPGTTATFSGSGGMTVTFSQPITAAIGTPETMYFCIQYAGYCDYPAPGKTYVAINTAPRLVSPLVTGMPGYYFIEYGTNDTGAGTFGTANFTSGSNTATGYTGTSDVIVGNYFFSLGVSIGASITAVSGTSGNYTVTFSGPASTASGSQNVGIMEPSQFTTYQTNISALVSQGFSDGFSRVFVLTTPPTYNTAGIPFNNAKILFNNWIKSTYGNGAVPNVTVVDIASAPELQTTNPNYLNYYAYDFIHPTDLGHALWARYVTAAIVAASATTESPLLPTWGWMVFLAGLTTAGCWKRRHVRRVRVFGA